MGTNYYLRQLACPHCGVRGPDLHIGKSSGGWNFGLRIYPKVGSYIGDVPDDCLKAFGVDEIVELDDWRPLFERYPIFDEYGDRVSAADMLKEITERSHPKGLASRASNDPRSRELMGRHHDPTRELAGKGTYDLCNYDFS